MTGWADMTAADLGRGIAAGRIDPVELTQAFLDAIEAHPDSDTIYARTTPGRAMAEAQAAAARAATGRRLSPLDGVPVSWKDLFDTAGTATEGGTAMLSGRVPDADAEVLRRATANGLVCLGKTHMSEIAFSGLGYNPVTATPPNRAHPRCVPGGSSSGAAASLTHGLAPLAIGSDTGGSVRIPAAWNDLVGMKPTHDLLPLDGTVPLCASFDTVGPLARSVEDAALAIAAMGGPAADLRGATLDGVRLAIPETILMDDLEDTPARAFEEAVARLEASGASVTTLTSDAIEHAYALTATLYTAEAYAFWRPYVETQGELMFSQIRERVSAGRDVLATDFIAAWDMLHALRGRFAAQIGGVDAVVSPTAALMPPAIDRLISDDAYYKAVNIKTLRNTRLANLMGLCSLTLPTGTPGCGVMFGMPGGDDARLLRLGAAAERALA